MNPLGLLAIAGGLWLLVKSKPTSKARNAPSTSTLASGALDVSTKVNVADQNKSLADLGTDFVNSLLPGNYTAKTAAGTITVNKGASLHFDPVNQTIQVKGNAPGYFSILDQLTLAKNAFARAFGLQPFAFGGQSVFNGKTQTATATDSISSYNSDKAVDPLTGYTSAQIRDVIKQLGG